MKKLDFTLALALVFAISIVGCKHDDPAAPTDPAKPSVKTPDTGGPAATPNGVGAGIVPAPKDGKPGTATTPETKPDGKNLVVPAALKTPGYDYYGLSNTNPVDFELKTAGQSNDLTGSRKFTLTKVENGTAYFKQTHTGGLTRAGEYELKADAKGVWVTSATEVQMEEPQLEIPAQPKPGMKWHVKNSIENTEYSVVGTEKVKTPVGTHDALLIRGSGTSHLEGKDVPTESKFWCVKGLGQVKSEFHTKPKDGSPRTVVMQESAKK